MMKAPRMPLPPFELTAMSRKEYDDLVAQRQVDDENEAAIMLSMFTFFFAAVVLALALMLHVAGGWALIASVIWYGVVAATCWTAIYLTVRRFI